MSEAYCYTVHWYCFNTSNCACSMGNATVRANEK